MLFIDKIKDIGDDIFKVADNLKEIYSNPRIRGLIFFLFILFFSLSIYIYIKFIHPKLNLNYVANSEFISSEDDKMLVIWFYTEWCPACKQTYNEWKNFKNDAELLNLSIPIEFMEIDCDKDENFANKFNINEYPSIRIEYKDEVYIYDAKPDRIELMNFLKGSIPKSWNEFFKKKHIKKLVNRKNY